MKLLMLLFFFIVITMVGCVKLPGGGRSYCVHSPYSKVDTPKLRKEFEYALVDYERYRNLKIGGSGIWCGIQDFYPMTIKWKRKNGDVYERKLDIASLIKEIKSETSRFPTAVIGLTSLKLVYHESAIDIEYFIHSQIPGKAGTREHKYFLTRIEMN